MLLKGKVSVCLSLVVAVSMLAGTFTGCGKKEEPVKEKVQATATTAAAAPSGKITDKPVTLKYWLEMAAGKVTDVFKNMNETRLYQEMEKRTGVKIEFLHPPAGQAAEQFNLMIASRELPDVIEYDWSKYPGGQEKAIKDGIIVSLNDLINKNSPNFKKYLADNPDVAKQAKSDTGVIAAYPFISESTDQCVNYGPVVRKDWMDELKIPVPQTLDDWYVMLKAFKEKKGATAPFTIELWRFVDSNCIVGAYDVGAGFYLDKGTVKYGPAEKPYKQYLGTMNKWYAEGLLDRDFALQDLKAMDAKITGGKSGASTQLMGGGMGTYLGLMYGKGTSFDLMGVPYPALKAGDKVRFNQLNFKYNRPLAAITTANKNQDVTARYLDYNYSPEGYILFNYGIEGESFTMVNGKRTFVDSITKPAKGTMANALSNYARFHWNAAFVQANDANLQFMALQQQRDAQKEWVKAASYDVKLPPLNPLPEENSKLAAMLNDINTYQQERFLKFILGQESLDKFDDYVAQLNKMGLPEVLKIYNSALERYNKR